MSRRATLLDALRRLRPDLPDPEGAIRDGRVLVDGSFVANPASRVRPGASVTVREGQPLRGTAKLEAALDRFRVDPAGAVALDAGAAAGGFTSVLLARGARRVYAVDAGHGQLAGRLKQDPRVVDLEATNIAELDTTLVPEAVGLVTLDLSYLALADAVGQLTERLGLEGAELVGLVKPMFELRLPSAPAERASLDAALARACDGVEAAGWTIVDTCDSPVTGARGARELLLHARRGP